MEDKACGSPLVSVIICTNNRAPYLDECLKSIYAQEYRNFEAVVVDDGPSTDDTSSVLSRYPAKVIIMKSRVGPAKARNRGIEAASGDILAFIDDDGTAAPDWLSVIVGKFTEDGSVQCVGGKAITLGTGKDEFLNGTVDIYGNSRPLNPGSEERSGGPLYNNVVGTNFAVGARAMGAIGGFDEYYSYYYEDSDIAVRVADAGYKAIHEPRAVVWHAHAKGPYRASAWDQNWYIITRNVTYFSLKNFGRRMGVADRSLRPFLVYVKKMLSFVVPFFRGEIPLRLMFRIERDVTRGFLDGRRDGKARMAAS